ncbi:MAG: hypothetical protein Q9220_004529 [cf. Caloplaca sp. 1 TL-2023]
MQHSSLPPFALSLYIFSIFKFAILIGLFAHTTEADSIIREDHNHHRLSDLLGDNNALQGQDTGGPGYEPSFDGLDRSIIGRASEATTPLSNNAVQSRDIDQGDTQYYSFPQHVAFGGSARNYPLNLTATNTTCLERDLISLSEKQNPTDGPHTVWITISMCDQPTSSATIPAPPPPLQVFISTSSGNQQPTSGRNDQVVPIHEGFGNLTLFNVTSDIWIGVGAPPASNDISGSYSYELAASVDAPYARYIEGEFTAWDTEIKSWDTDTNSSILGTGDITNALSNTSVYQQWMNMAPPFSIYVQDLTDPAVLGLQRSVCGLRNHASINESEERVEKRMVNIGGQPRQRFYVKGLISNLHYNVTMTLEQSSGNSSIGGGGAVWRSANFTTKSDNNCQIVYDLPFCTDVAYAVPSNPKYAGNMTGLASLYDVYANDSYQNFDKSLQQIPCETTPSAQYSLARNCQDCANAYKAWLCAVTIPRCRDFSEPTGKVFLQHRNLNAQKFVNNTDVPTQEDGSILSKDNRTAPQSNSSRIPAVIDDRIMPGPYQEMLPCKDLCYHLVQSCPAALGFACPLEGRGLNYSYGHYHRTDTDWYCNWPGGRLVNAAAGGGRALIMRVVGALLLWGLVFVL